MAYGGCIEFGFVNGLISKNSHISHKISCSPNIQAIQKYFLYNERVIGTPYAPHSLLIYSTINIIEMYHNQNIQEIQQKY